MLGHWGGVMLATCITYGIRAEGAISTQPLPVHLLDGPTADLQELGQFPLAHPLRPLHPDVLPLLLGSGWAVGQGNGLRPEPSPGPRPSAP